MNELIIIRLNKALLKIASISLAGAGLLLAVVGVADRLNALSLPPALWLVLLTLGIGSAILCVVSLTISAALVAVRWLSQTLSRRPLYEPDYCRTPEDVKAVARMAADVFGALATSEARTQHLHDRDGKLFQIIKDKNGDVKGYFAIVRLTRAGVEALRSNQFDITTCPDLFIRTDNKRSYSDVYIGAVYGANLNGRRSALYSLRATLFTMSVRHIFARAATDDGLRLLTEAGFKPTDPRTAPGIGVIFERKGAPR